MKELFSSFHLNRHNFSRRVKSEGRFLQLTSQILSLEKTACSTAFILNGQSFKFHRRLSEGVRCLATIRVHPLLFFHISKASRLESEPQ